MDTLRKIALASAASRLVRGGRKLLGQPPRGVFTRRGIRWDLDLTQGIDFSIYLLGGFEPLTVRAYRSLIPEGAVVIDIGANIGAHTLPLALLVGDAGRVIAFEPTDTAYGKLLGNLALNPLLSRRVDPVQAFLTADPEDVKPAGIPSFWPLDGSVSGERLHPVHGGAYQPLEGARSLRLDDWIRDRGCDRIDFLKIDVDGFEPDVLEGAGDVLRAFGPTLLMEFSPHVIEERGRSFGDLTGMLRDLGYGCRSLSGRPLPLEDSIVRLIPGGGSINVILSRPK